MNKQYALFTSTSDEFFAGTCVALYSFIKHNPWFDSDIIVVSEDLSDDRKATLEASFARLKVHAVDQRLIKQAANLRSAFPALGNRTRIFYNLHAFCLHHYDRVLKIDSDMLFRGSLQELFELDSDFAACHAMTYYLGKSRHKDNLSLLNIDHPDALPTWVNAGLYSVSNKYLNDATFKQLMNYLSVDFWGRQQSNHTDQIAVNLTFSRKLEILSQRYNYFIPDQNAIKEKIGLSSGDALVWHYFGTDKPWKLNNYLSRTNPAKEPLAAKREWINTYLGFLQTTHLQSIKLTLKRPE